MKQLLLFILGISSTLTTIAQFGTNDITFNPFDTSAVQSKGLNGFVSVTADLPDGKLIVAGGFTSYNNIPIGGIARLNADGSLDQSFNPNGSGVVVSGQSYIRAMALQPDGKIIIAGHFNIFNNSSASHLLRLMPDGSKDNSFLPGIVGPNKLVDKIVLLPDGKIIIAGEFTHFASQPTGNIIRLHPDGSLDTTFNFFHNLRVSAIAAQSDGKIIASSTMSPSPINKLYRLNQDGTMDSTFSITEAVVMDIFITNTDSILLCGTFSNYLSHSTYGIAKLSPDGAVDNAFSAATHLPDGFYHQAIKVASDGGIFSIANALYNNGVAIGLGKIFKYDSYGSLDSTFPLNIAMNFLANSLSVLPDGKLIIAGFFNEVNGNFTQFICRLHPNGDVDNSFETGAGITPTGFNSTVVALAVQNDDKIIAGGHFNFFNMNFSNRIIRLTKDGELDLNFQVGNGFGFGSARITAIVIQPDGKILVGGMFSEYDGNPVSGIVRLNLNGTCDSTFVPSIRTSGEGITALAIAPDGKIMVAGYLTDLQNHHIGSIARLNQDGSLDLTFTPSIAGISAGNNSGRINALLIQSDNKVIAGGDFTSFYGVIRHRIVRLNKNGTVDADYIPGANPQRAFNEVVHALAMMPDGKVIAAGKFSEFNKIPVRGVAVVNTDGTLDTTFKSVVGIENITISPFRHPEIKSIFLQPNGKILISGDFEFYEGQKSVNLAMLNRDGTIHHQFNTGSGFDGPVLAIGTQSDGKIIAGGSFLKFQDNIRNRIVRINSNLESSVEELDTTLPQILYPNPTNSRAFIRFSHPVESKEKIIVYNALGSIVSEQEALISQGLNEFEVNLENKPKGLYYIKLEGTGQVAAQKLILN
jgi:uncharacterized delta-60 repeat protein